METVEVVIKIQKKDYEYIKEIVQKEEYPLSKFYYNIANGTVLPKGHGRLIDADAATKDINAFQDVFAMNTDYMGKYNIVCVAPTVIEADRDCQTCENSKDGKCAGTEECHECMWDSQYKEVTNG